MNKGFVQTIKNGCVFFTIITVISYTFGIIISSADKAYIPSLKSIYIYLVFSLLFASANKLLYNKKINLILRLVIHFVICATLFFFVIVLGGGLSGSGFATIIMMFIFTVIYLIFACIFGIIKSKKEAKDDSTKEYSNVFK